MSGKLEAVLLHILTSLKIDVTDYCDIETVDANNSIVMTDGSLGTIVRFNGRKNILGRNEYSSFIRKLSSSIGVFFKGNGHQIQFLFYKDLDSKSQLERAVKSQRVSAEKLNLNLDDLIDETVEKNAGYIYLEECYMVFWSRPSLLDPIETKISQDEKNKFRKENHWPSTANAQNLLRPISYLMDRHESFVSKIVSDLSSKQFGCSVEIINVSNALKEIKRRVYPEYTSDKWKPSIPFQDKLTGEINGIPTRWKNTSSDKDKSEILYPNIAGQIMVATSEIGKHDAKRSAYDPLNDPTIIRVGARFYAPLLIKTPPSKEENFANLFASLNGVETRNDNQRKTIPYSVSFMIESDGLGGTAFKSIFANILSITSDINKNINLAMKALKERKRDGEVITKLRMSVMTWADWNNGEQLILRKSKLWKVIEAWGDTTLMEKSGNPMTAFQTNCMGLTTKHIGPACPAPLEEALELMPLTRPASPFVNVSTTYRSLDGKLMPWEIFSEIQSHWLTLVSGKPGSGKSATINSRHIDACLLGGVERLPWHGIIDIGISCEGFTNAISDALPPHLKHLVLYARLQNTASNCINPLDVHLGARYPLPKWREFIVNFITLLITPVERQGKPYEGMTSLVGTIIDEAYKLKDTLEKGQPNTYSEGEDLFVDKAIKEAGIKVVPNNTPYYDIVDMLFDKGFIYEAERAQRYAVPRLSDLATVLNSQELQAKFGNFTSENNKILEAFNFGLLTASNDYMIFNSSTKFDIGSARIIAIDLQDVVVKGSSPAQQQKTALMYMIARQSFMKKVAFHTDDLPQINKRYLDYYRKLINELIDENKTFCMDEFHNTGGMPQLTDQINADARESRKWKMEIILLSQKPEDFGVLSDIATTIIVMDSGTENTRAYLRENISLSPVAESALINHCNGANADGCTFLAMIKTKSGDFTQLFTATLGPKRLWRLSTTAEDRKLRTLLFNKMPRTQAIKLLATKFPQGGCKATVDMLKQNQEKKNKVFNDDEILDSVIEGLANQMLFDHQALITTNI
ncbi:TPA: type IV secretion protein DotO [Yersinia enterocolitica]